MRNGDETFRSLIVKGFGPGTPNVEGMKNENGRERLLCKKGWAINREVSPIVFKWSETASTNQSSTLGRVNHLKKKSIEQPYTLIKYFQKILRKKELKLKLFTYKLIL